MGDGGAAPMEVEMGENDVHNPTAQFLIKGERRGTQCFNLSLLNFLEPLFSQVVKLVKQCI